MERIPAVKQGPVRKRITAGTAVLFMLLLVLTLVSCGESGTGGKNGNTANTAETGSARETGPALETRSVRILATSDLHGKFMPWDYYMNEESTKGSAAFGVLKGGTLVPEKDLPGEGLSEVLLSRTELPAAQRTAS